MLSVLLVVIFLCFTIDKLNQLIIKYILFLNLSVKNKENEYHGVL